MAAPHSSLEQAIAGLSAYLPRYTVRKAAFPDHPRDSPRRARRLLDMLEEPERSLQVVWVIGTKGKGSTAAMLEAILRAGSRRTGLYTSPHLHSPRERIQVQGQPISRPALAFGLGQIRPLLEASLAWADLGPATLFEGLTALAMAHFARYGAEIAVVEAGMGGRYDATHAIVPILTLLTPIAMDHEVYLGHTLEAIAVEKAGGVPNGGLVLSAPQPAAAWEVVQGCCEEAGAVLRPSTKAEVSALALQGSHQQANAWLALAAASALREMGWALPEEALTAGLREMHWPGRLETVAARPHTIVDVAHNPAAAQALGTALQRGPMPGQPRIFLLGCSSDKDLEGITAALAPLANGVVLTRAQHHRAADPAQLAALWRKWHVAVEIAPAVGEALRRARTWAGPAGLVCACGSFFVIAEVREALGLAVREPWPEPVVSVHHPGTAP